MKNYILNGNAEPLILHGQSGCGKTAILAKFTSQVFTIKKLAELKLIIIKSC